MMYDTSNWYWIVAGDDSRRWSSKKAGYVPSDSPDYVAFLDAGGRPQAIASLDDLQEVFAASYPGGMLSTYANFKQWQVATAGRIITIGGDPVPFATTLDSMSLMSGKVQRIQQPNPPATVNWQTGPVTFAEIPAEDFIAAATTVADFVQSTFDILKIVFSKIEDGTITTREQIDVAFA